MCSLRVLVVSALALLVATWISPVVQSHAGSGTIEGRIVNTNGVPIAGAKVTVWSPSGGAKHSAISDANGIYRFAVLTPGTYRMTVVFAGFATEGRDVVVEADRTVRADVRLRPIATPAPRSAPVAVAPESGVAGWVESGIAGGVAGGIVGGLPAAPPPASAPVRVGGNLGGSYPFPYPPPWRHPRAPYNTTSFDQIDENPFLKAADTPLSTFSIDVDTASYSFVRRLLSTGTLPPNDAVRIEELINYFHYDYPSPTGDAPVSVTAEVGPCPWNATHRLAHIGLQAKRLERRETPPRNLVFLLDVSGSMEPPDKLPLVKAAMQMLATRLTARDRSASSSTPAPQAWCCGRRPAIERGRILDAIDRLRAGGSTNGGAGHRDWPTTWRASTSTAKADQPRHPRHRRRLQRRHHRAAAT